MKERVYVRDEPVDIDVYQKSKTVWIAVGEYEANALRSKDRLAWP
jgi:uncharacterized phage-associated protein